MTECDDGDYVRSEDYDRLTARVQELERENGELREQCGTLREARIVSVDVTGEEVWLDGDDYGGKRVALLPLDDEAKA